MGNVVKAIEAEKLLDWLKHSMCEAREIITITRLRGTKKYYAGYAEAMDDVERLIKKEMFLIDKEREGE